MTIARKTEPFLLLFGDLISFFAALWLALFLRYFEFPSEELLQVHVVPFSILFLLSVFVFYIAGLYEKHTRLFRSALPTILLNAQLVIAFLAVLLFYLVPAFGIQPRTTLFLYLVASLALLFFWRLYGERFLVPSRKEKALLIGSGEEVEKIEEEVNNNPRYNLQFVSSVNLDHTDEVSFREEIVNVIYAENISVIVIDFDNKKLEPLLYHLYNILFSKVHFIDLHKLYEELFDALPISLLKHSWFLENISLTENVTYTFLKRLMDIIIALIAGILSLPFYPLVYLLIKLDDGGRVFFVQERVGKNNTPIRLIKFRTMSDANVGEGGEVTRVGKFLRKTRVDELPQLINVLKGEISLIGPRPELPQLASVYKREIPYYSVRHLIAPGLSGWAQIKEYDAPRQVADVEKTRTKLSYDLYYLKNRSLMLDVRIVLKTIKTLLSRSGV